MLDFDAIDLSGDAVVTESLGDFSAGGMTDWGAWFQGVAADVTKAAIGTYKYKQILAAGGVPVVDQDGQVYYEGQRMPQGKYAVRQSGMSEGVILMLIAGVAAIVLLKS